MTDDAFESRCLRFEEAWARAGPIPIADFLKDPPHFTSASRVGLLVELIAIDLEFRWRGVGSSERLSLEDYIADFPELGSFGRLPLELIGEEYRVRRRWGDRPSHEEFLLRFSVGREEIRAELFRIDHELEQESAEPRLALKASLRPEQIAEVTGPPWFSHHDLLLRRLIGAGRIGKVYQALQRGTGRDVAVKFLRKTLLHEPEVVQRFIGEAKTVAGLRHPRIVGTLGLGQTPGGSSFIVMDLVAGPDLARLVQSRPINTPEALRWTLEACEALEHAHDRGVIHCDLKPANLLLDASGGIRVTDFGLARSLVGPASGTAEVEGTAPFMAPEQVSRCWGRIDRRTDVYGIGAVLFTLLTGRPPHVGRRLPDVLADVVSAAPVVGLDVLRPDLPEPIVALCRKCLAKNPEERFSTVRELGAALSRFLGYNILDRWTDGL